MTTQFCASAVVEFRDYALPMRLGSSVFAGMVGMHQLTGMEVATQTSQIIDALLHSVYGVENKPFIASLDDMKRRIPMARHPVCSQLLSRGSGVASFHWQRSVSGFTAAILGHYLRS